MAEAITLAAERRTETGKGAARQLRLSGRIPAVIYGQGRESESLSLAEPDLAKAVAGRAVGSMIFDLKIDGKSVRALIREIQRHPFRLRILHVDFYEIHAGEKLTLDVPLHLVGSPEGVRNEGGILDQVIRNVQIEVLPKYIPEHIEIDVSDLHVGQSLHVRDLEVSNAKILTEPGKTICSIVRARVELEVQPEVPAEEEEAEPELIRKPKEDEAPAEGEDGSSEE